MRTRNERTKLSIDVHSLVAHFRQRKAHTPKPFNQLPRSLPKSPIGLDCKSNKFPVELVVQDKGFQVLFPL